MLKQHTFAGLSALHLNLEYKVLYGFLIASGLIPGTLFIGQLRVYFGTLCRSKENWVWWNECQIYSGGNSRCDGVGSSPQDAWDYPRHTCGGCMLVVLTEHKMLIYKARASQSFFPWCLGKYPIEIWSIGMFYNSSHRKPNWDRKCTLLTQMTHFLQPRLVRGWKVCSRGGRQEGKWLISWMRSCLRVAHGITQADKDLIILMPHIARVLSTLSSFSSFSFVVIFHSLCSGRWQKVVKWQWNGKNPVKILWQLAPSSRSQDG